MPEPCLVRFEPAPPCVPRVPMLRLQRTPRLLRLVVGPAGADALDGLDDAPRPDERIWVYRLESRGTIHVDSVEKGRRVGRWYSSASYVLCEIQPGLDEVRDTDAWREWARRHDPARTRETPHVR